MKTYNKLSMKLLNIFYIAKINKKIMHNIKLP